MPVDLKNVIRETISELFEDFGETAPEFSDADITAALDLASGGDPFPMSTVDAETTPIGSDNRSRLVSEGDPCPKCKKPVVLGSSGKPECQNTDCDWTACEEQAQPESLMQPGTQAPGTAMSATEQQWAKDGAFYVDLRKELQRMIAGDPTQLSRGLFDFDPDEKKKRKPSGPGLFDESKHPRGQPENAGEFVKKGSAVSSRKGIVAEALRPVLGDQAEEAAKRIGLNMNRFAINQVISHLGKMPHDDSMKHVPAVVDKIIENLKEHDIPLPHESVYKPAPSVSSTPEETDRWRRERNQQAADDKNYADQFFKQKIAPETVTSQRWTAIRVRQRMEEVDKDVKKMDEMNKVYRAALTGEPGADDKLQELLVKNKRLLNKYRPGWAEKKSNVGFANAYEHAKSTQMDLDTGWKGEYISSYSDEAVKAKAEHTEAVKKAAEDPSKTLPEHVVEEFLYESWLPKKYRDQQDTKRMIATFEDYSKKEHGYAHGMLINALGHASDKLHKIMDKAGPPPTPPTALNEESDRLFLVAAEARKAIEAFEKPYSTPTEHGTTITFPGTEEGQAAAKKYEEMVDDYAQKQFACKNKTIELQEAQREVPRKWAMSFFDHGGDDKITIDGGDYLADTGKASARDAVAWLRKVVSPTWGAPKVEFEQLPEGEWRANQSNGKIRTRQTGESTSTIIHEYGHLLEEQHGHTLGTLSKAFAVAALKDHQQKPEHLGSGYEAQEIGNKDNFINPYTGKFYSHDASEVLSMGIQHLYDDPVGFYKASPAHFRYTIAALNGLLT